MRFALRLIVLLMVALPFTAFASVDITGNWNMTVPNEDGGTITIQVSIKTDGKYTVDFGVDGQIEVNGEYQLDGSKMTIKDVSGPQACPQTAVYTVAVSGNTLTMTRVSDPCEGRGGPEGVMAFSRS